MFSCQSRIICGIIYQKLSIRRGNMLSSLVLATANSQGTSSQGAGAVGLIFSLLPLLLLIYIIFDAVQRRKNTKKYKEMLAAIKPGDKVVTIGGLKGEVASINDKTFELKVDKGIRLEFERKAIAKLDK